MVLLRHFSILSLACVALLAKIYTYEELKKEPKSLAKDYYINRLINEGSYTKEQIADLSREVFRKAGLVQKSIDKILPPKVVPSKCPGVNAKNITQASLSCQNLLTTISFSLKLDNQTREILAANLAATNPEKTKILLVLNEANPAQAFVNLSDTKSFLELFNASSPQNKNALFSESFDANFMTKLYSQKGFTNLLNDLVFNKKNEGFRRNLLSINPAVTEKSDAFTLGLNAILLGQDDIAFSLFARAKSTFERAWQRDNATFWQYQISKNEAFLKELSASKDANIYSLYARDIIGGEPLEVIVPRPSKQNIENFDVSDPFLWNKTTSLAKDMNATQASEFAMRFYTNESIGAYAYFMQKAHGWEKQYFLMPSSPELEGISTERKSMIYALARQESLFIPSVVSTSYALGMMQFMPFLANAIGKKELKIPNFDQDDLFKTDVAFKFANHHLNYLDKFLYHPLFTAYAYNGGIGFTKKVITRDDMFKEGKFEPFLSIELVPVAETRNYGKKVLANYVIYMALNGSSIKISQLFENLTKPALTDKFRN
ncbi:lytic transglycosylase domain-containing protein [Campylobacter concisus]|uniref:lytic transglycosylase domain-containing protein n=1 Tax=Campylobacter concisus TaxID=199 RepID=UPI000D3A6B78|nr:lytic transglycosylase domain-containing protein [Campylobacter concisus]